MRTKVPCLLCYWCVVMTHSNVIWFGVWDLIHLVHALTHMPHIFTTIKETLILFTCLFLCVILTLIYDVTMRWDRYSLYMIYTWLKRKHTSCTRPCCWFVICSFFFVNLDNDVLLCVILRSTKCMWNQRF